MTPEQEKKVLESLYDRLYDAVTYSPAGKTPPENVYFQMTKNTVLKPSDFANMVSPLNPKGDQRSTEAFSDMVDALPNPGPLWGDSQKKLSTFYSDTLAKAVTDSVPSADQKRTYDLAYKYLKKITQTPPDMYGKTKDKIEDTDIVLDYNQKRKAYYTAVSGYRTLYNSYNLEKVKDQRAFNAASPPLQLLIDETWDAWERAGKAEVEDAQATMATTINNAVRLAIEQAQRATALQFQLPRARGAGTWLPSYGLPTEWAAKDLDGMKLTFNSTYLNKTSSTQADSYAAEASGSYGLFHASGGVEGEHKRSSAHMDAQNLELEAELITVSIIRPWFSPLLLGMNGWWVNGYNKNELSNGDGAKGAVPLIPTGFVLAKNVKISGDFSTEDKKFISNSVAAKASGGWGPFSFSGKYGHSDSKEDFNSKLDGGSLEFPGLQLIAWMSTITPASPPGDPKQ